MRQVAKGHQGNFFLTMKIRDYPPTKWLIKSYAELDVFQRFYLMILRNSRISSISLSAIASHFAVDFSIAQSISSLMACPRADLTAESCCMISRTPSSSSIICTIPRICHSIRRSLFVTRFFWSRSFIFTVL